MQLHRKILTVSATACVMSGITYALFNVYPCVVKDIKDLFPKDVRCQDYQTNHVEIVEREFIKWTPDGSRIIFDFDSHWALDQSIWSINHDGTDLTKLAEGKPYKWLPDKEKRTGNGPRHGFHADLSPDGKTLAYSVCDSNRKDLKFPDDHTQGTYDIAITRMDGEKPIVIAPGEGQQGNVRWLPGRYQGYPSWSPDGTEIAFIQGESGWDSDSTPRLFIAEIDQDGRLGNMRQKGIGGLKYTEPLWAPNGQYIAYMRFDARTYGTTIEVMQTTDMSILNIPTGISTTAAAWSPDSSKLASAHYSIREQKEEPYLEIANRDGSEKTRIQMGRIPPITEIKWHPDGSEILVGARSIYSVNVQDRSIEKLLPTNKWRWQSQVTGLAWSPDGNRMAVRLGAPEGAQSCGIRIVTADRDGGNLRLIVTNGGEPPRPFIATNRPTTLEEITNEQEDEQDCGT